MARQIVASLGITLLGVWVVSVAVGQDGGEVLTNADVVTLTEAGPSSAVILAKIENTPTAFDTSVEELVTLSQAGVDAAVIEAMIMPADVTDPPLQDAAEESIDVGDDASHMGAGQ